MKAFSEEILIPRESEDSCVHMITLKMKVKQEGVVVTWIKAQGRERLTEEWMRLRL